MSKRTRLDLLEPSNLGQIIGRLSRDVEVTSEPDGGGPRRRGAIADEIRRVLRNSAKPMTPREIASSASIAITVQQVQVAVHSMSDVRRAGESGSFRYALKESPP